MPDKLIAKWFNKELLTFLVEAYVINNNMQVINKILEHLSLVV